MLFIGWDTRVTWALLLVFISLWCEFACIFWIIEFSNWLKITLFLFAQFNRVHGVAFASICRAAWFRKISIFKYWKTQGKLNATDMHVTIALCFFLRFNVAPSFKRIYNFYPIGCTIFILLWFCTGLIPYCLSLVMFSGFIFCVFFRFHF